jgi:hypothetical protein
MRCFTDVDSGEPKRWGLRCPMRRRWRRASGSHPSSVSTVSGKKSMPASSQSSKSFDIFLTIAGFCCSVSRRGGTRNVRRAEGVDNHDVEGRFPTISPRGQQDIRWLCSFSEDLMLCLFCWRKGSCLSCSRNCVAKTIVAEGKITSVIAGNGVKTKNVVGQVACIARAGDGENREPEAHQ